MHENPLLPNVKLKQLYALMQRARGTGRPAAGQPRTEAILAATLMHLEPGDFVSPLTNDALAATLAAEATSITRSPTLPPQPITNRLAIAAGIAQGLRMAGRNRLAVLFLQSGAAILRTDPAWPETLTYAATAGLPLLILCADVTIPTRTPTPKSLNWASIHRLAKSVHLPILCVDATDAVAVYRVLQEATLRARNGGGPAVIWCLLPSAAAASPATDGLRKMKQYLVDRNLLPGRSAATKKKSARVH